MPAAKNISVSNTFHIYYITYFLRCFSILLSSICGGLLSTLWMGTFALGFCTFRWPPTNTLFGTMYISDDWFQHIPKSIQEQDHFLPTSALKLKLWWKAEILSKLPHSRLMFFRFLDYFILPYKVNTLLRNIFSRVVCWWNGDSTWKQLLNHL